MIDVYRASNDAKERALEEKAFMHRENLKRVKELQKDQQKEALKKQKILNDYKKSWHREALTRHIQEEIQNELKQAIREGKDLDTYEFDQEKFKKLEE